MKMSGIPISRQAWRYRACAEGSSREAQVTADEAGSILDDLKCLKSLSGTDEEEAGPG
jgi:hypothetical protein